MFSNVCIMRNNLHVRYMSQHEGRERETILNRIDVERDTIKPNFECSAKATAWQWYKHYDSVEIANRAKNRKKKKGSNITFERLFRSIFHSKTKPAKQKQKCMHIYTEKQRTTISEQTTFFNIFSRSPFLPFFVVHCFVVEQKDQTERKINEKPWFSVNCIYLLCIWYSLFFPECCPPVLQLLNKEAAKTPVSCFNWFWFFFVF